MNSTFYHYPKLSTVRFWRRRVPKDFIFSVKCHRDATHKYELRPVEGTFKVLGHMFQVCRLLRSEMLVLQTPATMTLKEESVKDLETMFKTLKPPNIRLIWEVRRPKGSTIPSELLSLMADQNIIRVTDPTREEPPEGQDLIYSRLFGREGGSLNPLSDEEIENIYRKLSRSDATKAVLTFHGVRMYQDAINFKNRIKSKI